MQAGYKIAQQNCFRCHNSGAEGGQKSGVTWTVLSALATNSPEIFRGLRAESAVEEPWRTDAGEFELRRRDDARADRLLSNIVRRASGDTMTLRTTRMLLVFAVAIFYSFVVFNNVTDYDSNYQLVRHTLMMDYDVSGQSRDVASDRFAGAAHGVLCFDHRVGSADDDAVLVGRIPAAEGPSREQPWNLSGQRALRWRG